MSPRTFVPSLALALSLLAAWAPASIAEAQTERPYIGSPERVGLELRIGTYSPDFQGAFADSFRDFYRGDRGPLVGGEIDIWAYRIPYVGLIGLGLGVGWARFTGRACTQVDGACVPTDQRTRFTIYPLQALAVLRIDVLSRQLRVPLIFTPKFGLAYTRFRSKSGGSTDGSGGRIGFQWGIQAALELDIFEPRAARSLDEEWGINHSYLFFELYGVQVNNPIDVGTDLGWVAGLGLQL